MESRWDSRSATVRSLQRAKANGAAISIRTVKRRERRAPEKHEILRAISQYKSKPKENSYCELSNLIYHETNEALGL
jgi:hypothetical protein